MYGDFSCLVEFVKNQVVIGGVDADASVAQGGEDAIWIGGTFRRDKNAPPIGCVFDRIDKKLDERLPQQLRIRLNDGQVGGDVDLHL